MNVLTLSGKSIELDKDGFLVDLSDWSHDVASALADERGWLRSDYTTDGLHPDYLAKKSMGEKIGQYLEATFPWVTQSLTKKTNS